MSVIVDKDDNVVRVGGEDEDDDVAGIVGYLG